MGISSTYIGLNTLKLFVKSTNSYVYPDSMVICGKIEAPKEDINSITNPVLIIEVPAKSTADYDRGADTSVIMP